MIDASSQTEWHGDAIRRVFPGRYPPMGSYPRPAVGETFGNGLGKRTYTVRRARPLARRRAKTFRPFFVLMRFRKPCSRLRLRLEGCRNVNDMEHSLSTRLWTKGGHYMEPPQECQCDAPHRMGAFIEALLPQKTPSRHSFRARLMVGARCNS